MRRPLLLPMNLLYRIGLGMRQLRLRRGWEPVRRLRFPVISIGNLSTGGAGKTPFAIALARALSARGFAVDVLSRGYGRKDAAPARVDPGGTPREFGDEPLLIARDAGMPVYVAADRFEAGVLAEGSPNPPSKPEAPTLQNARAHLLDDGFQHRQLHRDVDLLLINHEDWHDRLLPAGNLREPRVAARRAHVICIPDSDPELERELRAWGWQGPVWRLRRRMEVPPVHGSVVAFCGIARPQQFFAGLEAAGLQLAARVIFPDHHRYTPHDLDRLRSAAQSAGAVALITTGKDLVRVSSLAEPPIGNDLPCPTLCAGLILEIDDEAAALEWLIARVTEAAPPAPPL